MSTRLAHRIGILVALAALAALSLVAVPVASSASTANGDCVSTASRQGRFGGIFRPLGSGTACAAPSVEPPYAGAPPLINHGGPVMAVPSVASTLVITPIYWVPAGYHISAGYKSVINTYLADVAADSGKKTNVFSTNTQYPGSNGSISYHIVAGTSINDATAYPVAGCTVNGGPIYSDGTGYSTCLDDAQLTAEINTVVTAHGFPRDLGHIYPIFTPKRVESCFYPGNPSNQACTINSTASTAFCAYHSYFGSTGTPTVYANMPFPIYQSATGYSCTAESLGGGIQSPNGNVDADVVVSPYSHELSEAITDPELNAWYDSAGFENGDDCAYIYGTLSGTPGAYYNQVINTRHYLTQEEFSNADFVVNVKGCLQRGTVTPAPKITSVNPTGGPIGGGNTVTISGQNFNGATAVMFGTTGTSFSVVSNRKISATAPAHAAGRVAVRVTTRGGTSQLVVADRYTYS